MANETFYWDGLNIVLVFETFLAKERCFLCLTCLFSTILCPFGCFSVVSLPFFPFGILAEDCGSSGVEMYWIASTLCKVCIHSWHALMGLDLFVDLMFIQ